MKKIIFVFIIAALFAFKVMKDNNLAEVEQVQGFYVFMDSKPVKEYEYLGTVKSSMSLITEQYQYVRDALIKKARKEYPAGDGVILHLKSGGDKADVIKFKE